VSASGKNDDPLSKLLDTYEFHLLPIMNPDGYTYTYIDGGVSVISSLHNSTARVQSETWHKGTSSTKTAGIVFTCIDVFQCLMSIICSINHGILSSFFQLPSCSF